MELSNYIDHTLLKANATEADILQLCEEAKKHNFYAICVNSCYVAVAKECLKTSKVKLAATIGFPLGASSLNAKIEESRSAIRDGAEELDMVMNIGFFKEGKYEIVRSEIEAIKKAIGDKILKVIIETCYLDDDEIRMASELVMNAGADFVKTSTGFGSRGASLDDIKQMKEAVGDKVKIKASGGIRDAKTAKEYINLGVSRIGTSSGIKIVYGKK
jgi:deoxyribose-phosphate aldolase